MICSVYHSYFILDVDETRNTFTMFGPDSLPKKTWDVDKKKYGIAKEVSDAQKLREMRIISMESVYKKIEDPMERFQRERMEALANADSTKRMLDSAAFMARGRKPQEDVKNIDQMIYLHHFGKYLPKRGGGQGGLFEDLKEEKEPEVEEVEEQSDSKKKKKLWPFGKNKKKKKNKGDALEEEESQEPDNN